MGFTESELERLHPTNYSGQLGQPSSPTHSISLRGFPKGMSGIQTKTKSESNSKKPPPPPS